MANTRLTLISAALFTAIGLILAIRFYQLGPPGIQSGSHVVLSSIKLPDDSVLRLCARKTGAFVEAYEVSLYHFATNTNVFVAFLGHEEPFWWFASMGPTDSEGKIEIRAFGKVIAFYLNEEHLVRWNDSTRDSLPAFFIDGDRVKWKIPPVLLEMNGSEAPLPVK